MLPQAIPPGGEISTLLGEDDRRLESRLEEACRASRSGDAAAAAAGFATFESRLRRHLHAEEQILFPAFESLIGTAGPTHSLRGDHRRIRDLLEEIAHLLAFSEPIDAPVGDLRSFLEAHDTKEAAIVYATVDEQMPPGTRAALARQMAALLTD